MRTLTEALDTGRGKVLVNRTARHFRIEFRDYDTSEILYTISNLLDNVEAYKLAIALVNAGEYIEVYNTLTNDYITDLIDLVEGFAVEYELYSIR